MGGNENCAEHYRLAGMEWVEADAAARILEETKTVIFSQMMSKHSDMPVSRAEHLVRGSTEWHEWVHNMVEQRTKANAAKIELRYREMKFMEHQSHAATARAERRM